MNADFTKVEITNENMDQLIKPFSDFDKRWALLTSGTGLEYKDWNTMTVSWGSVGILWNKIVAIVYVRPTRFTHEFTEKQKTMTLSFFPDNEKTRKALQFCGSHSGRDYNKMAETGLKPFVLENKFIGFEQAGSILALEKLYSNKIIPEKFLDKTIIDKNYPRRDFHTVYICEIVFAFVQK